MSYPQTSTAVTYPLLTGITDRRLDLFLGGHYAAQNLSAAQDRARVDGEEHVRMHVWSAPGTTKPGFDEAVTLLRGENVKRYRKGDALGPSWTNHWVHVELSIPKEFQGRGEDVIFQFDPNCEGLIYTLDGNAVHAITGGQNSMKDGVPGTAEDRRVEYIIPQDAVAAGHHEFYIELSINAMFGLGLNGFRHQQPDMNVFFSLALADIVLPRSQGRALELDFKLLTQLARMTGHETSTLARRAVHAANEVMNAFTVTGSEQDLDSVVSRCRAIAAGVIGSADDVEIADATGQGSVWGIGHCHIDTAWLWQYTHSQQKIARSWSTQLDLFKRYPWHQFAASSAQQYAWLEELYPAIFREAAQEVQGGRFHPVGGAWLEHDCVLPSGESMCRQYLYGQRYFETKFGKRCREAWLPDTFGYASQLPQILRLAGLEYFFTQKLSWNNINTFPHTSFNWVGLDGTQVLSHMTPVDTYNAQNDVAEIVKGATTHKNAAINDECLLLFGNGDGGGGPTPRMLEKFKRLSSLGKANPSFAQVKMGTPAEFFDSLLASTAQGTTLPTWRGELYFELHRGTYTSQEGLKRGNREMEMLLRDVEYYATVASLAHGTYEYPRAQLDAIWKDVLLNQFHDVLPGTSIKSAIDDALDIYTRRKAEAQELLNEAIGSLLNGVDSPTGEICVLDPIRLGRQELISVPAELSKHVATTNQVTADKSLLAVAQVGSTGVGSLVDANDLIPPSARIVGTRHILSNAHFELVIEHGRITSFVDLALDRELIAAGPRAETGGLDIFDDLPLAYDAWDAEVYHLDCAQTLKFLRVEVGESGPLRASLRAFAEFGSSVAVVTFSLDAVSPSASRTDRSFIQVDVAVDWHEKHRFLKFSLPLDIYAPTATYGTQFGLIDRPTHRNTTQEQAKFEVCAHGCADLSEMGYGVTLASPWKYGYAVEGNTMRLSLLRSSTAPDPTQDQGHHDISFAIMPHVGRFLESGRYKDSMRFNNPVHLYRTASTVGAADAKTNPLVATSFVVQEDVTGGVVLETVKRGENDTASSRSVVLRMFDALGGRTRCTLRITGLKVKSLAWVNILEEDVLGQSVEWEECDGDVVVKADFRGFEIKTLMLSLA